MPNINFIPKGSMCINCTYSKIKCDHLPFDEMNVIETCKRRSIKVVVCSEYLKKEK